MEEDVRAHISAITGAFADLLSVLAQRGVIDKGDVAGMFDIMLHTLRGEGHEHARDQLQTWKGRIVPRAKDSIPLPES